MSQVTTVNYTNDVLEQMRCSVCKRHLSCSPICVLSDGSCMCGRCSPTNSNAPVYRALPFELLLRQVAFPCQFKERGCTETILFDQAGDHESKCAYRSFACPSLNPCAWLGVTSEAHDHFSQKHPGLIKETADFKFNINEDVKEVFMVVKDGVVFIIKYLYNVYEHCLKYDVRCFMSVRKDEGTCKIQLINDKDPECNFNLKTSECLFYDNSFYDMQNAAVLNVSKCLEILDNPNSIAVIMDLKVKSQNDCITQETKIVNYELLESIKCKKCKNYLIPPIFDVNCVTVCCNCAKLYSTAQPSSNTKLVKLVSEINYPCQWHNCNFVGNCDNIQMHIMTCQFRQYRCCVHNCGSFVSLTTVAEHLQSHDGCEYLPDGNYKIIFSNTYGTKFMWTIKNGMLIVIKFWTSIDNWNSVRRQNVCLVSDLIDFTVSIQFEHQHCRLKSEPFPLSSNKTEYYQLSQFPFCFKDTDELTVSIGECKWTPT